MPHLGQMCVGPVGGTADWVAKGPGPRRPSPRRDARARPSARERAWLSRLPPSPRSGGGGAYDRGHKHGCSLMNQTEGHDRRAANIAIGQARQTLRALRLALILFAALVLATAVPGCLTGAPYWNIALAVFVAALLLVAAWRLFHRPVFWTLLLALIVTLGPMLSLEMPNLLIVVLLWLSFFAALRAQRLMRRFPDAVATRRFAPGQGGSASQSDG